MKKDKNRIEIEIGRRENREGTRTGGRTRHCWTPIIAAGVVVSGQGDTVSSSSPSPFLLFNCHHTCPLPTRTPPSSFSATVLFLKSDHRFISTFLPRRLEAMTGREILHEMKEKVGLGSAAADSGKGKSKMSKQVTHGFYLVKGKAFHAMEDYAVSQFKQVDDNELGLFAIFDGHLSHDIPDYLRSHLFDNIINEPGFWSEPEKAIRRAYCITDTTILDKAAALGKGGSTAVTAILINCHKLIVANVGDSRAVISKRGTAKQLSVDHEPNVERKTIENRGGFVSNFPGDVPRVDGQLAVARAFGDKSLKEHLSSEPDVTVEEIDDDTEVIILASDGLWKVMSNQEAVDSIKNIKDPRSAAKHLAEEALNRESKDDISCIVVRFH